jgi:hypothetical protein
MSPEVMQKQFLALQSRIRSVKIGELTVEQFEAYMRLANRFDAGSLCTPRAEDIVLLEKAVGPWLKVSA